MRILRSILVVLMLGAPIMSYAADPVWDANKVELKSEKLADGVFAIYPIDSLQITKDGGTAATSGGFIVGDRGVMIIETMINKRLSTQAQALVKKAARKDITYAVNTSAHGDHTFGNLYLPKNVKIIQHVATHEYIAKHTEDDKKFMIQNFGTGRGIEEVKSRASDILIPKDGKLLIDLGNKKVEIIDFGFAQTGGDLFIWEPQSKVLWAGNAIVAPMPAVPWLLQGQIVATYESLKKVHDFLPDDARIIPGHGVEMKRSDIRWHLDYLAALQKKVKSEIAAGATEADIASRVPMPEFSGYKVYGWIHSGVNVPAAYKEFRK